MLKRWFDISLALWGILILLPFLVLISLLVLVTSPGGVFYVQTRVGRNGRDFRMFKFRTMRPGSDKSGLLTVGNDSRITGIGKFLRVTKMDELPQLFNVLAGSMSFVGPRPEVRKYVEMYSEQQRRVLTVRPGITDYASIEYFDENRLLGEAADAEKTYIEEVMPAKLELNMKYIEKMGVLTDLGVIFKTVFRIFR